MHSLRIALAIPDANSAFRRACLVGAFSYASQQPRWKIVRKDGAPTLTWEAALRSKPDGILGIVEEGRKLIFKDTKRTKVVVMNVDEQPFHKVASDNVEAGRRGALHLLERHIQWFAFVGASGKHFSLLRQKGFELAVAQAGCPHPVFTSESAILYSRPKVFAKWLHSLPVPCGILCANDNVGLALIRRCLELGKDVPGEVAVVGISNNELTCLQAPVTLTSVPQNFEEVGHRAARQLDALLHGETGLARCELIPPGEVVERESTRMNAISDPLVSRALTIIHGSRQNELTVNGLLVELGKVSRRLVEQRFRLALNRSPHQVILAHRVRHAQFLIRTTPLSLERICYECNFYDPAHFCRQFKRETGQTPSDYRRAHGARQGGGAVERGK